MQTRLTQLLGIRYPIVCGGMQRIGTADLVRQIAFQFLLISNSGLCGLQRWRAWRHYRAELSYTCCTRRRDR